MFCPMKLYLEKTFGEEEKDILLHKTMKELRIDVNDLFQRNLKKITKEMDLEEIEENLNKNIKEYIESSLSTLAKIEEKDNINRFNKDLNNDKEETSLDKLKNKKYTKNLNNSNNDSTNNTTNNFNNNFNNNSTNSVNNSSNNKPNNNFNNKSNNNLKENYDIRIMDEEIERIDRIEEIKINLETEIYYNLKILSLKTKKAILLNQKDGSQIAELFFPTAMYSYLMRDTQLDIVGTCDKIEIIDGKYFPISIKSSNPPLKGVWDGDAIELIAAALLIENEFDAEVFVGFVDYLKLGERRVVVMDANLRKSFFRILNEVDDIVTNEIMPEIKKDNKKCHKCVYNLICNQELGFE
jgi:CRISPR-associated exonuclease Cas4